MRLAHIEIDSEVEIEESDGKIIITPMSESYNLDCLLNNINDGNLHKELSFGSPVGKESL
ncbi:hypothetical protein L3V86_08665 [Thiotrichales bacterium 19S11-10]|nr:hypothetical protein [Thiotrichales bacterium 19S11-10]